MGIVSTRFGLMVPHGELEPCITWLEEGMRCLSETPYHRVVGMDFLGQADELAAWLADFHVKATRRKLTLAALYLEMNGFTINTRQWHCDLFGYKEAGGRWDLGWLARWDAERKGSFVLRGMTPVRQAFAKLALDEKQPLGVKLAEEVAEHLVTARFLQLVAAAHAIAKETHAGLRGLPVFATAHDWDVVHRTE